MKGICLSGIAASIHIQIDQILVVGWTLCFTTFCAFVFMLIQNEQDFCFVDVSDRIKLLFKYVEKVKKKNRI